MRPLWALLIYIVAVLLGGALLAPWLYKLAQASAHSFPGLARSEFYFFVQNSLFIVALAGSWLLFRSQGAKSLRDVGLVNPLTERKKILGGFALGFASLAVVAILALVTGVREFRHDLEFWRLMQRLTGALLTAFGVAFLEETLFRGAIFGALRKEFHWKFALVVSSMVYAFVHFLASAKWSGEVTWLSGLQIMPQVLAGFVNWEKVIPAVFNLTLAGALLALAYQRTGNLCFSIGVHAGWVFWIKSYMTFTTDPHDYDNWFIGSNKMVNGWAALIVLTATLIIFTRLPVARKRGGYT